MSEDAELEAMHRIKEALSGLDEPTIARVLRWTADRYGVAVTDSSNPKTKLQHRGEEDPDEAGEEAAARFREVADLYDAASPKANPEKALVAAYWYQVKQGQSDFTGQQVNGSLKHLGQALPNVTAALTQLMNRKPRLVMQIHKAGKTVQARKKYKLTVEGIRAVEKMIKVSAKASS